MNKIDYNSPSALKLILDSHGFSMQKKFGQNFLINQDARKKLIDSLDITEKSRVWEIGPGLGAMTSEILSRNADLTVFEIDKGFVSLLNEYFADYSKENKFRIVEGDVLKNWKTFFEKNPENKPDRLFGNLPYNIAATVIADTIENNLRFDKCVFTVQKEVALRMAAKPGSEDYSSFSVLCQWAYDVKPLFDLTGGNFWPKPNVDSRSILFIKKEDFPRCSNPDLFVRIQRQLFSSRRKNVRNNLNNYLQNNEKTMEYLSKAHIDPAKRAEVLSVEELLRLSDVIDEDRKKEGRK